MWNSCVGPFSLYVCLSECVSKEFSNRDITILSMNKTQKYLRYWVQIYCGCSGSITFHEWNSISVACPPKARLQRSILWTQFSTTLAHISTGTLAISRGMLSLRLSLRSSKVADLLAETSDLIWPHKKKSNGLRSHERGGRSTGPFLKITRSPNLPFNKSIVTRAVWLVAPSC